MTLGHMQALGLVRPTPSAALVDLPRIRESRGVIFLAFRADSRPAVAMTIEGLINYLDETADDPDVEANGDEADASYPERHGVGGHLAMQHPGEDDEDGHDREQDHSDVEPEDAGDFDGSGCRDDEEDARLANLAELGRLWHAANPKTRAAALALARKLAAEDTAERGQ